MTGVMEMRWKSIALGLALSIAASCGAMAQVQPRVPPAGLKCSGDQVVWVNTRSGIYHYEGDRYFGGTIDGRFACERDAARHGGRASGRR
jgi:hypothetical protein